MSNIAVSFSAFNRHEAALLGCMAAMYEHEARLRMISARVDYAVASSNGIGSRLKKACSAVRDNRAGTRSLRKTCNDVERYYRQAENKIADKVAEKDGIFSALIDLFAGFGIAGTFTDLVAGCFEKNGMDIAKSAVKFLGNAASLVKDGTKITWKSVLGLDMKTETATLTEQLKKYVWQEGGSEAAHLGTIAKWGGAALTLVGSFVDNYDEFGGKINERMIAETAVETAVDIGTTMLLTAAVGGIATVACGPVFPVVAAVGGLKIAGDFICNKITGKGFNELVSDFLIDRSEDFSAVRSAMIDAVKDAVNAKGKKLMAGISCAWNSIF